MTIEFSPRTATSHLIAPVKSPERRTAASYERELTRRRRMEIGLREALAFDEALLCEKEELIRQQQTLSEESDHRLLNGVQLIVSLLSLQSRAAENPEVAAQLAVAADRIATIGRIHRSLHSLDSVQTFALKPYIEDLGRTRSGSSSSRELTSSCRQSPLFHSASFPTN